MTKKAVARMTRKMIDSSSEQMMGKQIYKKDIQFETSLEADLVLGTWCLVLQ